MIEITRTHEICCGHRVMGHEGKCKHPHGHNYLFEITIEGEKDTIGRVLDFSVMKNTLCNWLEVNWDHKFIVSMNDPLRRSLEIVDKFGVFVMAYNPTAENLAEFFGITVAPDILKGTGVTVTRVKVWETSKCSATWHLEKG